MLVQCSLKLTFPLFLLEYNPHEELNIDKAMIPYKDCLFIKQYIKDKPMKWDITMFALANARNSYTVCLQVHTGRKLDKQILIQDCVLM